MVKYTRAEAEKVLKERRWVGTPLSEKEILELLYLIMKIENIESVTVAEAYRLFFENICISIKDFRGNPSRPYMENKLHQKIRNLISHRANNEFFKYFYYVKKVGERTGRIVLQPSCR